MYKIDLPCFYCCCVFDLQFVQTLPDMLVPLPLLKGLLAAHDVWEWWYTSLALIIIYSHFYVLSVLEDKFIKHILNKWYLFNLCFISKKKVVWVAQAAWYIKWRLRGVTLYGCNGLRGEISFENAKLLKKLSPLIENKTVSRDSDRLIIGQI